MSNVQVLIQEMLLEKKLSAMPEAKPVRFSITLTAVDYRRLKYIAKKLGVSRSSCCAELIEAALRDAELEMGLDYKDQESSYSKLVLENEPIFDSIEGE